MRWPWQRRERDPVPATSVGRTTGVPSTGPPEEPPRPPADPVPSPAGWAFLPPLQRTVEDFGTTTAPHSFPDRLPTRTNPSFTRTMSHLISAQAPPGVIDLDGPDAAPLPGSSDPAVDLPLLPAPAPHDNRHALPVQRAGRDAPTTQRPLTVVADGDFDVLRLPVVPGPAPEAADEPPAPDPAAALTHIEATPEGADAPAIGADAGTVVGAPPDGTPAPAPGGSSVGRPDAVQPLRPAPTGPALPLQRRAQEPSGPLPGGPSGSGLDGAATSVPLPARPTLQRDSGAGAAPVPAPPRSSPAPSAATPPPPHRLGLGRPWSGAPGIPEVPPEGQGRPGVQRTPASPGATTADPTRPSATAAPPEARSPHGSSGGRSSAGSAVGPLAPVQEGPESPSVQPPSAHGPAPVRRDEDAAGPPSRSDGPRPTTTAPVVARWLPTDRAAGQRPPGTRSSATSRTGGAPPIGAVGAPFPDPPLSAGGQSPDAHRAEALPVLARAVRGPVPGGPATTRSGEEPAERRARSGARGAAAVEGAADRPLSAAPVSARPAAPVHGTVQRTVGEGPGAVGGTGTPGAGVDTAVDSGGRTGTDVPPPGAGGAEGPAQVAPAFSSPPAPPSARTGGRLQEPGTGPRHSSAGDAPGAARAGDLPVVSRRAVPAATGAGPAAVDPAHAPSPGAGTAPDPGTDGPRSVPGTDAPGPTPSDVEPSSPARHGTSGSAVAEAAVSRWASPSPVSSGTPPPDPVPTAATSVSSSGRTGRAARAGGGTSAGPATPSVPTLPVQRAPASPRPVRPSGLRPPAVLHVVARSAGDGPEPPAPGTLWTGQDPSRRPVPAPVPREPSAVPSSGVRKSTATGPGPVVSRPATTEQHRLPASGTGPAPDPLPPREVAILSAASGSAVAPGGEAAGGRAAAGDASAPVGALQRSGTGPTPSALPGAGRAALPGTADDDPSGGTAPVALRLVTRSPASPLSGPVPAGPDAGDLGPPGGPGTVQRVAAAGTPVDTAPAQDTRPSAAPVPPGRRRLDQEEVDELAKQLVGPIVRRIKAEMLLDRERRGLRIDAG